MDWKSYEEVVKYIYEQLGKSSGVKVLGYGASCKIKGKSGVSHQLDVLTEHDCGIHSYKTAIECKYWKEKVQKDTVAKLAEILEDGHIEKGVVVSKSGFTDDAVSFAKYKNISLIELREPTDADWEGRIKNIEINLQMELPPRIEDFQLTQKFIGLPSGGEVQLSVTSDCVYVVFPDSKKLSLAEIIADHVKQIDWQNLELIPCEIKFPDGSHLVFDGLITPRFIEAAKFNARKVVIEQKISVRGEDHIAMIMNCLFEDRSFVIEKNGQIRGRA